MDIVNTTTKIIALIPFKNEEWVIKEYINTIKKITDHIIAYDDNSTDATKFLLENAGAKIITENYKEKSGWAEHSIRERLLNEGRRDGGTHFICLDADEVFTNNFIPRAKDVIGSLKPGQSLWLDWVTLYKDINKERIDGIYKKINKSFIFCDDREIDFPYAFLGVSRTPGDPLNRVVLHRKQGSVIHYQFLNTERSTIKRVWYMCSELIKRSRTPIRINTTYDIQKDRPEIKTRNLTNTESFEIVDSSITTYDMSTDWRYQEILQWFDVYGIEFFDRLDIWYIPQFMFLFKKATGRTPSPQVIPLWLMKINDFKNKIILMVRMIYSKNTF